VDGRTSTYSVVYDIDFGVLQDGVLTVYNCSELSRLDLQTSDGSLVTLIGDASNSYVCVASPGEGHCASVASFEELSGLPRAAQLARQAIFLEDLPRDSFLPTQPRSIAGEEATCQGFSTTDVTVEACSVEGNIPVYFRLDSPPDSEGRPLGALVQAREVSREVDELVFLPPYELVPLEQLDLE
jgi:hypothetical protein